MKIILERENYEDVFLRDCEFEILGAAPILSFEKLEKIYGNIPISENEIFGKIRGLGGLGYKIKRIFNLQDLSGVGVAEIKGKTLKMNKIGKFKIDISLELAGYENAEIRDCEFEIKPILLKITGLQNGDPKIYDGTPPTPKGTPRLSGFLAGDVVNLSEIKYYTDGAGTDLPIKVNAKLGGADAGKYELSQELSGVTQTLEAVVTFITTSISSGAKAVTGLKNKFKALTGLKIVIPAKIDGAEMKIIKNDAFKNLTGIEEIRIEEGITNIQNTPFLDCENLIHINIPGSISDIGFYPFYGCTKLEVLVEHPNPEDIRLSGFPFSVDASNNPIKKLKVPAGKLQKLKEISNWQYYVSIMEPY